MVETDFHKKIPLKAEGFCGNPEWDRMLSVPVYDIKTVHLFMISNTALKWVEKGTLVYSIVAEKIYS